MNTVDSIEAFLASQTFAVVGASRDRAKYGNKVLRAYLQAGREVYPVNPHASEVEGANSVPQPWEAAFQGGGGVHSYPSGDHR